MFLTSKFKNLCEGFKENLDRKKAARLRIWNAFCEETPLQGFLIFSNSTFRVEKAIWLLLIAIAIGVTFRDSMKTIHDYIEEETLSKVSMDLNESLILPNPTICMMFNLTNSSGYTFNIESGRETKLFLQKNKDKIQYYFGTLPTILDSLPITDDIASNYTQFLQDEIDTLMPILYLTQDLVESIRVSDAQHIKINSSTEVGTPIVKQPYQYLNDFLYKNNINLAEAVKAAGMYICILAGLNAYKDVGLSTDWCRSRYVTWLEDSLVCVRGSQTPNLFNFTAKNSQVTVAWHPLTEAIVIPQIIVHFDRPPLVIYKEENSVGTKTASLVQIEVISTKAYPTRKSPCVNEVDFEDCRSRCFQDLVRTRCGCTTLSAYYLYCSDAVCNDTICLSSVTFNRNTSDLFIQQTNCKAELYANEDLTSDCEKQCPKACLRLHLQFTKDTIEVGKSENELVFGVPKLTYLNIEQALAMDTQTFMSNLGGNLGLYIGATFLALFHLITSLVHLAVSLIRAKEDSNTDKVAVLEIEDCSTKTEIHDLKETVAKMKEEHITHLIELQKEIKQLNEQLNRISTK